MQTETQKNWNKNFKNKKKTNAPKIILGIIVILIIIGSIINYKNENGNLTYSLEGETITDSTTIISNKNGLIMHESLEEIEEILQEIDNQTIDTLKEEQETISEINLSSEYDDYKETVINKIELYINYISTGETTYLEEFNDLDVQTELINSFEKADIKYTVSENNTIKYWYHIS